MASNAPIIVEALKTLLMVILETIRTVIPELFTVATEIVIAFADAIKVAVPYLVEAGLQLVLGVAGLLLAPVVPVLLALSGVIALLGVGALACGIGLTLVGTGIAAIGAAVAGSGLLIVEFLNQLIKMIPSIGTKLAEGFINFGVTLASNAPIIVEALKTLLMTILDTIRTIIPELFIVATEIVIAFADAVKVAVPYLVEAGLQLVLGVLFCRIVRHH